MSSLYEQQVRLYWCVLEFEGVIGVRHSMRTQSHSHVLSKYTTIMAMTAVRLLIVVECMERCCVGCVRTGRTFVLVYVCLDLKVLLVFDPAAGGRNLTLMYCPNTLQ